MRNLVFLKKKYYKLLKFGKENANFSIKAIKDYFSKNFAI
jgi:hypothetical protein